MNILTIEMQYQSTFFIIPQVAVRLGKSWNVSLNWLNFELEAWVESLSEEEEKQ